MEEHRCKISASGVEDPRCEGLLGGVVAEMEDRRCEGLNPSLVNEIEDDRCNSVQFRMEDARCSNLLSRW